MWLLLIKLLFTPLLMVTVSWSARRWGPGIGGLLAGLPLTSGPISIYLWAEQGPGFAAAAAGNSLLSLTPVALFSVVYSRLGFLAISIGLILAPHKAPPKLQIRS